MTTRAFALFALVLASCEHGVTLKGTVTVPVDVQQRFSAQSPGVVYFQAEIPKTGTIGYRLAVLCAPQAQPLAVPYAHDGFGCAKQGTVTAWVAAAPAGEAPTCGVAQDFKIDVASKDQAIANAQGTVFSGDTSDTGCSSGKAELDLTVQPTGR